VVSGPRAQEGNTCSMKILRCALSSRVMVAGFTASPSTKKGVMFDASGESDLTEVLQGEIEVVNVTSDIMDKYRALGISKYNWFVCADVSAYEKEVLLVDQSRVMRR
jgi:hypothetical protein